MSQRSYAGLTGGSRFSSLLSSASQQRQRSVDGRQNLYRVVVRSHGRVARNPKPSGTPAEAWTSALFEVLA